MTGTRWSAEGSDGDAYAATFDALAASGADVHGEAALVHGLLGRPARVLDAGCGTGRVAIRLAELGHEVVGVDVDAAMLAVARNRAAHLPWVQADLAAFALDAPPFDVVVCAGNVVPLAAPGTEPDVVARMAAHLAPTGLLVAGFGLHPDHLPASAALLDLDDYDTWCAAAGLSLRGRLATWDGVPYDGGGYAVSIHGPKEF